MEQWWGKRFDRSALKQLYGELDGPLVLRTLERGKPHEQAVAIALLGEQRAPSALKPLAEALTHPYPLLRPYAKASLERITHSPVPVDLHRDDATIQIAAQAWLANQLAAPRSGMPAAR